MKVEHIDPNVLAEYFGRTRWFGGKGRPFEVTAVERLGAVPGAVDDGPRVVVHLVELTYGDPEGGTELYQVPLALYTEAESRLDHAFVGWWEEPEHGWVHAYDALHDKVAMASWLRTFVEAEASPDGTVTDAASGLSFHRVPGHALDSDVHSALFSGEQSNSSVLFGEDSLMKLFRKVTPGRNPDITVHEVLTRAGSEHVAALYGWVDWRDPASGEVVQLAMLQEFLRTATDGWDLALTSVRDLFAEADLHAHEVGGDFAGEASRLGEALREVHTALATHFPTEDRGAEAARELAEAMRARLDAALPAVPELAAHADTLRAAYDRVAALPTLSVQQVHGDLHLGQTLRTSTGWRIVDFEGEPAKPLAERQLPDSPWRDVAGMLRSFDYAPRVVERSHDEDDAESAAQRAYRAEEWAHRNRNHFLVAYAGGEVSDEQRILLDAYVADKAVYETVYETRNRPTWVSIPLEAIARIGDS
ncbi:MAG TPA: phosphotransferase [Nocardioides sp.]|uniref:maltokinase N-terminal cap-like domain-containing protein n=1 Tax=Nocardioides sp. TaxID=35761 RepID=UPI002CF6AA69|nr:phosphotransferase [Nocardioides sp.]HTW17686.1 phosphotransferase [Nocardioides sp.]